MTKQFIDTLIEGVATHTDDQVFQLTDRDRWLNVSNYAEPTIRIPEPRQRVQVGLDKNRLQARVIQRLVQRVHVFAILRRPGSHITADGTTGGSCEGFAYCQSCTRVGALRIRLARFTRSRKLLRGLIFLVGVRPAQKRNDPA